MADLRPPKIHLTVRVLPPEDVDNPPGAASFLMNIEPQLTFFVAWRLIDVRYKRDYPRHDWVFKKIQDAYGADISLGDTLGDVFEGEDRTKCVVHVLQIQSHRENTVPEGSHLRPPEVLRPPNEIAEAKRLQGQEERYGFTVDRLDPDHPIQSGERELGPNEQRRDRDGFLIPEIPAKSDGPGMGNECQAAHTRTAPAHRPRADSQKKSQQSPTPNDTVDTAAQDFESISSSELHSDSKRAALLGHHDAGTETTDIAVTDPIEDDQSDLGQPPAIQSSPFSFTRRSTLPEQASQSLRKLRLNRDEDSDVPKNSHAPSPQTRSERLAPSPRTPNEEYRISRIQNLSQKWTAQETDTLVDALARELDSRQVHHDHFAHRTWESVRKKVESFKKLHSGRINARKQTLSIRASSSACNAKDEPATELVKPESPPKASGEIHSTPSTTDDRQRPAIQAKPVLKPASLLPSWSKEDDELFERAIRDGQSWKALRDRRFPSRSEESIMRHFTETRLRVEAEDRDAYVQKRVRNLTDQGKPPSRNNEPYKQYENDLLLAARLEKVEIKRVAKDFFPLRDQDQVAARARSLYKAAQHAVSKKRPDQASHSNSSEPTIEEVLECLEPAARERIEAQRKLVRSIVKKIAEDRTREYEFDLKIANNRSRAEANRDRAQKSAAFSTAIEAEKRRDQDIKSRRLAEDLKNEATYRQEYAAWYEQANIDKAAGKPAPPSPKRPLGSRIGTEVVTVQPKLSNPSESAWSTAGGVAPNVEKRKFRSSSRLRKGSATSTKENIKRSATVVEVRIPVMKKPKLDPEILPEPQEGSVGVVEAVSVTPQQRTRPTPSSPFIMLIASQKDDHLRGSSHSAMEELSKASNMTHSTCMSSQARIQTPTQKIRQTTLPFARSSSDMSLNGSIDTPGLQVSGGLREKVPNAALLSSDDTSSYSDSDLDDEDLTELADKSSEMFRSSPPREEAVVRLPQVDDSGTTVIHADMNGNYEVKASVRALPSATTSGADEGDEVEELNPEDLWRSAPSDEESHLGDERDMMDMDDARDLARANGQYFQGDAPGTFSRKSNHLRIMGREHVNSFPVMATQDESTGLPRVDRQQTPSVTMPPVVDSSSSSSRLKNGEATTQDMIPFPSSGKVRAMSVDARDDDGIPREERPVCSSPIVRAKGSSSKQLRTTKTQGTQSPRQTRTDNLMHKQEALRKLREKPDAPQSWRDQLILKSRATITMAPPKEPGKKKARKGKHVQKARNKKHSNTMSMSKKAGEQGDAGT